MNSTRITSTTFASSVLAFGLLVAASEVRADDPATVTATAQVNLVSQYRFRGVDQSWGRPAVQGGADVVHASGLYAGVWASNVSGNSYPGGSLELDLSAGYNGRIDGDFGFTAGGLAYLYPGAGYDRSAAGGPSQGFDTFELNGGVNWRWLAYKLSVSTGDYFGANPSTGYSGDTRGSMYHDLSATITVADGVTLAAHLGRTDVRATYAALDPDYTDYRIAVARTFAGGWNLSAALVGADNDAFFRPPTGGLSLANGDTRALNKPVLVLQAGRTF